MTLSLVADRVTISPPGGAGPVSDTVTEAVSPPFTDAGLTVIELSVSLTVPVPPELELELLPHAAIPAASKHTRPHVRKRRTRFIHTPEVGILVNF